LIKNGATHFAIAFVGRRQDHVGYRLCRGKHIVFLHRDWIRHGMRPARGEGDAEMIETLALGLVTVALLVYLVYALLRPEKF
jgi:K+-transporting ATPase KdpF subunit